MPVVTKAFKKTKGLTYSPIDFVSRCTILRCVGSAAYKGKDLKSKADEMCQKFIMPAMQSALPTLKVAALKVYIYKIFNREMTTLPLFG